MKQKTIIIAEAGVNHNGDLKIAEELIQVAAKAGADFVKFQTFQSNSISSKLAGRAEYQKANMKEDGSQISMLKKLELNFEMHQHLIQVCKQNKIQFLSTAFDLPSIDLLIQLGIKLWKIPSGEITNYPYLKKIGSLNGEVILSTGMSNLGEIEAALSVLENAGTQRENITVLHCTTEYPAPMNEVNLRAMFAIQNAFGVKVGYSDHTVGIEISLAAVALGANMIEKHFTLDRNLPGPDHKASLEPNELNALVSGIRNIELALGDGVKKPFPSEIRNMTIARKSLIAKENIRKGEIFTEQNVTTKRPGNGISPMRWDEVMGKTAFKDFLEDELIEI
ncbi:N-acetylneuraminate synthase [Leptospira bandrabouensis]|uniref:N-acetylneuraminate synthase n=1 Tax=Leptospira bandrabouensis TaxID=2484903 RepID=A0A6H3NLJ4_9LEPT|nr:N-acetylneuraminate synthase [Leptospira bandrabouensis]MCG6144953.1 N-acetylneuraminate synthase [Leptospira bandrabouensis]MCG6152966.1 N-acetylneuraminate synthase [Leptospira bandrabouensis]MCG6160410.1 N-acetylneuraminate synthase [Leptospira bandrabouensis]MCG6164342.1 N-acetylneuraminate synthase [Leptospira bandrabouensis]MCW7460314.1 N-acetylneuraminate synthase [Leptospira bandrabouensis]